MILFALPLPKQEECGQRTHAACTSRGVMRSAYGSSVLRLIKYASLATESPRPTKVRRLGLVSIMQSLILFGVIQIISSTVTITQNAASVVISAEGTSPKDISITMLPVSLLIRSDLTSTPAAISGTNKSYALHLPSIPNANGYFFWMIAKTSRSTSLPR